MLAIWMAAQQALSNDAPHIFALDPKPPVTRPADVSEIEFDRRKIVAANYVKMKLRDPASAQIRFDASARVVTLPGAPFRKSISGDGICGWVNAKNGYGGYVGEQRFVTVFNGQIAAATVVDQYELDRASQACGR